MNGSHETAQTRMLFARLPRWLNITGIVVFLGTVLLEARLVWEQTVWTWEQGPQMEGFSLVHGPGAILIMFPLLLIIWTLVVIVLTVRSRIKTRRIAPARLAVLGIALSLLVVGELPDGFWQRIFIKQMAASSHSEDLLLYAAYRGDLGTVKGLVSRGVSVNSIGHADWRTALHGAAVKGDLPIIRYLVSHGANINALDRSGDSPLELAASANRTEAAKFLTETGAKRIRGDESQRQKAIDDRVREAIESLNPDSKRLHEEENSEKLQHQNENQPTKPNLQ